MGRGEGRWGYCARVRGHGGDGGVGERRVGEVEERRKGLGGEQGDGWGQGGCGDPAGACKGEVLRCWRRGRCGGCAFFFFLHLPLFTDY